EALSARIARAVVEHMAQVMITAARAHFDAAHAERVVLAQRDRVGIDGAGETRPARAAVVLGGGGEQRLAGARLGIDAGFVVIPVFVVEGPLGAALVHDPVAQALEGVFRALGALRRSAGLGIGVVAGAAGGEEGEAEEKSAGHGDRSFAGVLMASTHEPRLRLRVKP